MLFVYTPCDSQPLPGYIPLRQCAFTPHIDTLGRMVRHPVLKQHAVLFRTRVVQTHPYLLYEWFSIKVEDVYSECWRSGNGQFFDKLSWQVSDWSNKDDILFGGRFDTLLNYNLFFYNGRLYAGVVYHWAIKRFVVCKLIAMWARCPSHL